MEEDCKLREARLDANVNSLTVIRELASKDLLDVAYLFPFIEKGNVRPTPAQFRVMCDLYGKRPSEIFSFDDVDYGILPVSAPRTAKKDGHKLRRKITVRLTDESAGWLRPEILSACGYPSKTAWLYACVRRLEAEYCARQRHKKTALPVGAGQSGTKNNSSIV